MSVSNRNKQKSGVLICGAYGMRNAWDEAVLDAILAAVRAIDPDMPVTVLSRDPAGTEAGHGAKALHMFNLFGLLRTLRRSALYLNGGGSLIQDVTSSRSIWYYLFTLYAAKACGCKVMMYGCGVGPVSRPFNRRLAARVINRCVDAVTLREEESLDTLRALGVDKPDIQVAAEPALCLPPAPDAELDALWERLGLERDGRYFCFCPRRWAGMQDKLPLFAAAADYVWRTYGLTPLLLSVNQNQDGGTVEALCSLLSEGTPCRTVTEAMRVPELIGLLSRMQGVLAMRLHVLIFAASQAVPMAGVCYDPKVTGFLDYIGERNYVEYARLETAEQLCALIDAAARSDRARLAEARDRLLSRERRNGETARRLLNETEGDGT